MVLRNYNCWLIVSTAARPDQILGYTQWCVLLPTYHLIISYSLHISYYMYIHRVWGEDSDFVQSLVVLWCKIISILNNLVYGLTLVLHTSQAPASALDDFIPGFHETFTAWVLQSCDRDELHCGDVVVWCGEGCRRRWHENWCCGCSYFLFWKLSHKSRSWLGWAGLHPSRSNYQQQPGHGRDVIRNSLATANNAHIWCSTQHFRVKTACSSFPCEF